MSDKPNMQDTLRRYLDWREEGAALNEAEINGQIPPADDWQAWDDEGAEILTTLADLLLEGKTYRHLREERELAEREAASEQRAGTQ